ncbi:MAG: radical SAM protein [Candidatus Omnitrophota bacterium]|nr:MAG: radical SAM protein [Candidatus Omnitrophota bacterium]
MFQKNKNKIYKIKEKLDYFLAQWKNCRLCPRQCGVDRSKEVGFCQIKELSVYTAFLHRGEEPPLVGEKGSGTIFFSGCNLRCIYCQNFKFSHLRQGKVLDEPQLASLMLKLQAQGAKNINLVTPTHFLPQIIKALLIAYQQGLNIPIVYNSSGYERPEIIKALEGIVDIYLVDMKYFTSSASWLGSRTKDYPFYNRKAVKAMYQQIDFPFWEEGLLKKGIIIRHLLLPTMVKEAKRILWWIKANTPQAYISVMFQYRPYFKASSVPRLNRPPSYEEYLELKKLVEEIGLQGWIQEFNPPEELAGVHFNPF